MSSFDILSRETPLQRRLFLEASAGTGKTFTIEHLVVRLLLETDLTLDQILVVTFTRAATRELKVRIQANLEKILSGQPPFDYLKDITSIQREKIKNSFLTFDQAQIFTIHGFCHRLLQEFAFEAFVGLELQEWEEKEEKWAILQFLRTTEKLSPQQLKRLLGSFRNEIEAVIAKLLSSSEEASAPSCDELLQQANQNLSRLSPFAISQAFAEIRPHYKGMTSPDFEAQAVLLEKALFRGKLLAEEWDDLIGQEELFLEKIETGNLKARTKFTRHPALEDLRSALLPALETARHPRKIFQALAGAWQEERKKLSRLHEKISPDDLLKMVQERLSEASFIEKVRKKYQAVIVDEFQDTDPCQWKIFETLFFSDPAKSVYLVGDPKQSIYAFRKADIYTFLEAAKGFGIEQKAMLTTNYRSTQGLLDALNRLLCGTPWLDLPKLNQNLPVPLSKAAKEGEGDLCFMVAAGELGRGKKWPTADLEQQLLFPFIAHEIHRLQLEPREIAILVKDRYQALRVKQYLQKWQIPCVLYRGSSLGDSLMVALLEEVVDACHGANSLSSIKKVLLEPFVRLPIEELTDEAVFQAKAIFAQLAAVWLADGFAAFFARFLQTRFHRGTALQMLLAEEILYDDLMQIVEKILYIHDPHQMTQALQLLKVEESDERISAHPHGIQIMTIHASKGLEFETVFALGLASRTTAEDKPDDHLKELDAEKMRQLYVALTRAKRRLYIPLLTEKGGKPCNLGEASPLELFWERAAPDLHAFTHVDLNQMTFDLRPYQENSSVSLVPPPSRNVFFKPLFLQSFTSLAQPFTEGKIIPDALLPPGAETGIVMHRIFERLFDQQAPLPELIAQEARGSHLEGYETVISTIINQVLDLPLNNFCLRDVDASKVMPEMEFLFPIDGTSLKGFIDLCFEYQGTYYVIDWKTNILENYTPAAVEKAMIEHDYLLQGKIYATALKRYLNLYGSPRFGGVFFLFVRGPAAYHFIPEDLHV